MKKLLTIVAICLLCFSQSQARMNLMVLGGQTPAAPAGGGCPSGTYLFAWDGDHASGGTYACDSGGTAYAASSTNGGTIDSAYGVTGNGFRVTDVDQYMEWSNNFGLENLVTGTGAVTIWMSVRCPSPSSPDPNILEMYNDDSTYTTDYAEFILTNGNVLQGNFSGNGTDDNTIWSGTAITGNTWARVAMTWTMDNANPDFCVNIDSGTWECDNDDPVDFSATAAMKIVIGERRFGSAGNEVHIDNVYVISGYQQADPL